MNPRNDPTVCNRCGGQLPPYDENRFLVFCQMVDHWENEGGSLGSSHSEPVSAPQGPPETSLTPARLRARVRGLHRALALPELEWPIGDLDTVFGASGLGDEWEVEASSRYIDRRYGSHQPARTASGPQVWPRRDPFRGLADLLSLDARVTRVSEFHHPHKVTLDWIIEGLFA